MADSPSDVPATSVNPDPAQAADEASAVPTNPPAVDAIDTPADDPGPVADPADVDHVLQEYPWLASELLYFATDDEGRALIDRQEADEEAGTEEQQRFLAFEVSAGSAVQCT